MDLQNIMSINITYDNMSRKITQNLGWRGIENKCILISNRQLKNSIGAYIAIVRL